MLTPLLDADHHLLECHLERWGLTIYQKTSFVDYLQTQGIAPVITVTSPKAHQMAIRASDLVNHLTWKKFLLSGKDDGEVYALSTKGLLLAEQFQVWVLTAYTRRYRLLVAKEHRAWLRQVVLLVVFKHLMERKWHAYAAGQQDAFADEWVAKEMGRLMQMREIITGLAPLLHHIQQGRETAEEGYEQFFLRLDAHCKNTPLVIPPPLPSLPERLFPSFLLLTSGQEEVHE